MSKSVYRLGDLYDIKIGGTPDRSNLSYWNNGVNPWVSIRDLSENKGGIITHTAEKITDLGVEKSNVKLIKKGTIIMSFKLSLGKLAIAGKDLYTNEAICGFENKRKDLILDSYLYHILSHYNFMNSADVAIKGATLNKDKIENLEIEVPDSLDEQKRIVGILSNVDKNIKNAEEEVLRNVQLKSGFLEQVVNRHLKIGLVPLEDYCDVVTDGTHDSPINVPKNKDHIIPFVTSKNLLGSEGLDLNNITYITLKDHELIKKRSGVGRNTLLIGMIGTIGEPTLVDTDKDISVKNVAIIKNKDLIKQKWVYYLLGSDFFNKYIKESQAGGVLKFLSLSLVRGFNVPDVPSDDLVKDVKALDLFEANIKNKKEELEKLQQLKKGLLNKLL